jgi:hypothetical protein
MLSSFPVPGAQAQELARRLGPLAGKFPRSLRTAVRLHRVPKDLEGEVWCVF